MTSLPLLLLALVAREPAATSVTMPRGVATYQMLLDLEATPAERLQLLSIGHHESRWETTAVNPDGGDCGPTQVRAPEMWGSSCAAILADPAEGYRVALRILRHARTVCPGTWGRVLTVYVSGRCEIAPSKAREICAPTGLCDTPSGTGLSADPVAVPNTSANSVLWLVRLGDRGFWAANDNAYAVAG